MLGGIYRIEIQGHRDCNPHPHVVLLEFDFECLVVPAFGSGGTDLEQRIVLLEKLGIPRHSACIELDNSKHVTWESGFTGKLAHWCVWRHTPLSKKILLPNRRIGQMDDAGMLAIYECMIRYISVRPEEFAKKRIKRVCAVAEDFRRRVRPL